MNYYADIWIQVKIKWEGGCMDINVRLEEEKDYRRVEEITRIAFSYPDRIPIPFWLEQ